MMLNVEGVFVIYDGGHRLRLAHHPARPAFFDPAHRELISESSDHLWPSASTGTYLRRQIAHGQRVVVAVDAQDAAFPPTCPPVPLFDWLRPADQARGFDFLAGLRGSFARPENSAFRVEESLVGSGEPLRFLVQFCPLGFTVLQGLVRQLYQSARPQPQQAVTREFRRPAKRRDIRAAA